MAQLTTNPLSLLGDEFVAAQRSSSTDQSPSDQNGNDNPGARSAQNDAILFEDRNVLLSDPVSDGDGNGSTGSVLTETNERTHGEGQARLDYSSTVHEVCSRAYRPESASCGPILTPGSLVPAAAQDRPRGQQFPPAVAGIKIAAGNCSLVSSLPSQRGSPSRGRSDVNYSSQSSPARIMARGRSLSTNRRQDRTYHDEALTSPELRTGEIVHFFFRGRPYVMEADQEDGSFYFTLGNPDASAVALEVMKDAANGYYGFRAQKAGDRFLQSNKRKCRRPLLFYNHNFGTNEQWKLLQHSGEGWTKKVCAFQHRRNEDFVLEADVHRIAHYDPLPTGTLTPRSLSGPHSRVAYPDVLHSRLLKASERIDKNILTYAQMKARIAELQQQVDASKAETQQMVLKLQEDMLQKLNAKESAINVLEGQAARMLNWGVRAITSRNNAIILREAMATWRGMTLSQVEEQARERKVKAFVRRFLQAQLLRAWNSWQETVLEQRNIRTKTERAVRKLVHRHTSSAFLAWREHAMQIKHARGVLAQSVRCIRLAPLRCAFRHWETCTRDSTLRCHFAELLAAQARRRRLSSALRLWHESAKHLAHARSLATRVFMRITQQRMAAAFQAWACALQQRQQRHEKLRAAIFRLANRSTGAAFRTWHTQTVQSLRHSAVLGRCLARISHRMTGAAFESWRASVATRKRNARILERCYKHMSQRRLAAAMQTWRELASAHRRRQLLVTTFAHRMFHRTQAQAFLTWKSNVNQFKTQHARSRKVIMRLYKRRLSQAFGGFVQAVRAQREFRWRLESVCVRMQKASLTHAWDAWGDRVTEMRERRTKLATAVKRMKSLVLVQAMHTWRGAVREAAAERAKLRKAAKRMQARSLAAAFSTWEDHATQAQHMRRRELVAQAHQERRLQRVTLRVWQVLALGKQRHHSKTLMVSVMRRLQQRGIAAAFQGWRENAQELVRERRLLARSAARFQRRLLLAAFYRFREAAQSQRLGKKLVARCLARARNHLLAKAFAAFKESRSQRAEQQRKLRRVIGKLSHTTLARAFDTWKVCLLARQERLCKLQAVTSRWSRLSLGWAFNSWTAAVAEIAEERAARVAKLVPTVRNAFTPTVRAAFGAWRDVVAGGGLAEREQRMLKNVLQRMRLQQVAAAFDAWCQHAHERRQRKCRLVLHIGNRVMSEAFNQWVQSVRDSKRQQVLLAKAVTKMRNLQLRGTFDRWREQVERVLIAREQAAKLCAKLRLRSSVHAFNQWHSTTQVVRETRVAAARVLVRVLKSNLSEVRMQAFEVWRMNALEVKLHRQRLDKAVRRFRRIALAAAWNKWREAALARRRYGVIIAKCHSRVTSGTLSRAFRAWCGEARATRRRTGVLRKAIFKLANRKTASAFAAWKQGVAEAVTRKRVLDMSLRRMRSVALASAFGHWAGVTNSANRQGEHEALVSDKKLLSRVFFAWKAATQRKRKLRLMGAREARKWTKKSLAAAFATWRRSAHAQRAHEVAVLRFRQHAAKRNLKGAFAVWRAAQAKRQTLTRSRRLVERRQKHTTLARAFYGWMLVQQEAISGRERVRKCVAGQRIAFQCFGRWCENQLGETEQQLLRKLLLDGEDEASFQEVEYSSPTHHATPRNLGPKVAQKLGCPADGIPLHGKLLISQPGGSPTFSISSPMTATASLHIGPSPPDPV